MSLISEKIVKNFNVKVKRTFKNPISVHSTVLSFGEKPVLRTREYTIFRRTIGGKPTFSGLFTSHLILSFHLCYFLSLICDTFDSPVLHYGTNQSRLLLFPLSSAIISGNMTENKNYFFAQLYRKKIGCFKATDSVFTMFISIRAAFISIRPAHRKRCPR